MTFFKLTTISLSIFLTTSIFAQENEASEEVGLKSKIQNPIADLISAPFQNNTDFGTKNVNTLNIQPVIPVKISKDLLLVTRTIVPVVSVQDYGTGVSNINLSGFLTSRKVSKFVWAVGAGVMLPSIDKTLGFDRLGIAPSLGILYQDKGWTYGAIVQNFFGVNNKDAISPTDLHGNLNLFYSQFFIVKNLSNGWYVNTAPIITANWEAENDNRWTVPAGAGLGKLFFVGKLPINAQVGAYKYIKSASSADWQLRAQVVFILPNM